MRVLHIYSGNLYGGIESMLVTLARAQEMVPELQHEFALAFRGRLADELEAAGAPVYHLGAVRVSRPQTLLKARRALWYLLRDGRYAGAICHGPWPHALFAKVVRRAGLPLAFWKHSPLGGRHWTERWARRTAPDLVIANSEYTQESIVQFWPSVPSRVIYCPVADQPAALDQATRAEIRARQETPADAVVIIQVSRMEAWKGHELLLMALERLRDQPDWHCWIVGGAQRPQEREYLLGLERHVQSYGLTGRVHFLGERSDVPQLLRAADLFCQPNLTAEPFGISLVEALYAGLPVVTTALGGAAEIVDESCGVLTEPSNVFELTEALRSLLSDFAKRAELGAAGPQRASKISDPVRQSKQLHTTLAEFFSSNANGVTTERSVAN